MQQRLLLLLFLGLSCAGILFLLKRPAPDYSPAIETPHAVGTSAALESPTQGKAPTDSIPPPPATESSLAKERLSQEDFVAFLDSALSKLPKQEELKNRSEEEVHGQPQPLVKAAIRLGEIAQVLDKNPELGRYAIDFYQKCASQDDVLTSVRALCYQNYLETGRKFELEINQDIVPTEIKELAEETLY